MNEEIFLQIDKLRSSYIESCGYVPTEVKVPVEMYDRLSSEFGEDILMICGMDVIISDEPLSVSTMPTICLG